MSIGIVGSGVAGLHLGLFLRQHDVPVTIYADKTAEEIANGRIQNTVAHHHTTLERERELGVHFWDVADYGYDGHYHYFGVEQPLYFFGGFGARSSSIDYRLYLPRLTVEYEERGGELRIQSLEAADVERLSRDHDLMVICSGRAGLASMFPKRPEKSPYDRPQRRLCGGHYSGITRTDPVAVSFCVWPGHGELLELPMHSREGPVTVLLFESIPGGEQELLTDMQYEEDPALFERTVLEILRGHYPKAFERVDASEFGLTGPLDLLQGAVTPVVREDYVRLPTGKYALAVGDAHTVVDPIVGQGANLASYSALKVGSAIVSDYCYDERFCQQVAHSREERLLGCSDWVNFMLAPPPPHLLELVGAMSQNRSICDEFTYNFNEPEKQWDILATPERTHAFLATRLAAAAAPA
jgi:2-polyprenyl-6-methoxyphenol hydroxylase-like FAD-dependent oxidoreductase